MPAESYVCNLGRLFARTASRHSSSPAVRLSPGNDIDYRQLESLVHRLTSWLLRQNAGPGTVVALQNGKTLYGYATMLACLQAGAAYVNLDAHNPPERLARILSVCRPIFVLCDDTPATSLNEAASRTGTPVIALHDHTAEIEALAAAPPSNLPAVTGADPAYLMFTSGSTGTPKGVAISHGSVMNFVSWALNVFSIGPGDVVANVNPIYFDNSVFDFYAALFSGACLAPIATGGAAEAATIARRADAAGCTIWFSVPSLLIYLMTMKVLRAETFQNVRAIVFGGEGYPRSELSKLFNLFGERSSLYNVYGPTEGTCICSVYRISADDFLDKHGLPPLGRIADNFSYLVLDGDAPVAPGEPGELCLMGPQVALGYYNDPERTAASFVHNRLSPALPRRMYRTGDLVRDIDGMLHFIGRKDNQIKHMGYRIELEEIEDAINQLGYVVQTAVIYKRVRESFGHIVAYVATGDTAIEESALRRDLGTQLPGYMVPNRFVVSRDLPKNANGKVDRVKLSAL